ncbi:carboxypeptidase regulatory-like domain-containing protein [Alloacidobacterium dinghuense]|uniref:Carboxypeptidase regulatory-like domain-containing protein n=1 Tax=Alloacidobacterium dinghuense TaxID=2763107 RepID=A0A7G8BJY2_9BACT|nr:carboxypeptidase-like regulatory domain-containing protein [Alloacidobacterium dinghuense]QNI32852.1 carboxypeptidase regulatory-like domain-containing protein [Alloacidobacterium dinghuense]
MHKHTLPFRTLALTLCFLMAAGEACLTWAQAAPPPKSLQIVILDGEGALNNIKQRTAHEPIVEVQDENHKPVAGAAVIFLLPNSGAGGTFNGALSFSTITDADGKAVAQGLRPNNITGKYQIQVRAKYNDLTTEATIAQENVGESTGPSHVGGHALMKWLLIGGAAAGAGVAIGIAVSQSGTHSTSITAGQPTVGAP